MEVKVSKGFLVLAHNSLDVDYVQQAYALALSIKSSQQTVTNISLVTNDPVPEHCRAVFDQIIPIPWSEGVETTRFVAEHRWKLYHATPYEETIVLDTDMLFLEDISQWWEHCSGYDINFCNRIKNYKLEVVTDTVYRKTFIENKLTSPYFALHYFKKTDNAHEFYKVLEFVCNNWKWCYNKFAPIERPECVSMDVSTAIAIEITGIHDSALNALSPLEFIHMKPLIQGWDVTPVRWQDIVSHTLNTNNELVVGNIKQSKIFHYTENEFLTDNIIKRLEELANGKA